MVEIIHEHSVDTSLLKSGGVCIDGGCLDFSFSMEMARRGLRVFSFDIQDLTDVAPPEVSYSRAAITASPHGIVKYKVTSDRQAMHVSHEGTENVTSVTLEDIYKTCGEDIDILKLDIEGGEYEILKSLRPVPKQISVEFHAHAHQNIHKRDYYEVMKHLLEHYTAVRHEWETRHGAGFNYWDSLFIRKDLLW